MGGSSFFNTLGVVFTIIGLGIALYQIAELRSENEIRKETVSQVNKDHFLSEARQNITILIRQVRELQIKLNKDVYSIDTIQGYINQTNDFEFTLTRLRSRQLQLACDPIIDCENCVTLVVDLRTDMYNAIEEQAVIVFRRSYFNSKLSAIVQKLSELESTLTT